MTSRWVADAAFVRAPAKINVSLRVVGRRADGYHLLDSLVAPIDLYDDVELKVAAADRVSVSVRCDPPGGAPSTADNLAVHAARWILERTGTAARVLIHLAKRIPAGAGLGGGSSDAAAVLRALNALLGQPVAERELVTSALPLGADVPLFLYGRPARMQGVGERLEPWAPDLHGFIVLAFLGEPLATATVYAKYDDLLTMPGAPSIVPASGRAPLRGRLHNDLEAAAFHVQPGLVSLKKRLRSLGAEDVSMTGSGSALFGMWNDRNSAETAARQLAAAGVWTRVVHVLDELPAVEIGAGGSRSRDGRSPSW